MMIVGDFYRLTQHSEIEEASAPQSVVFPTNLVGVLLLFFSERPQ
jgi:hypothetical protein